MDTRFIRDRLTKLAVYDTMTLEEKTMKYIITIAIIALLLLFPVTVKGHGYPHQQKLAPPCYYSGLCDYNGRRFHSYGHRPNYNPSYGRHYYGRPAYPPYYDGYRYSEQSGYNFLFFYKHKQKVEPYPPHNHDHKCDHPDHNHDHKH